MDKGSREIGFSFIDYIDLLSCLQQGGYKLIPFHKAKKTVGPRAIIRHDVDVSLQRALVMAEQETAVGVNSTYFVLISSQFYNLLAKNNEEALRSIASMGHEIGLHFDLTKYRNLSSTGLESAMIREIDILSEILGKNITSISWHIPRKDLLGKNLRFLEQRGILNAYDKVFFSDYKYFSDSMMRWRDLPTDYIDSVHYPRLQILTHPIWYSNDGGHAALDVLDRAFLECEAMNASYIDAVFPGYQSHLSSRYT